MVRAQKGPRCDRHHFLLPLGSQQEKWSEFVEILPCSHMKREMPQQEQRPGMGPGAGDWCFCLGLRLSGFETDLGAHLVRFPVPQVGTLRLVCGGGEGRASLGWA